jgi:hypothetical protein
MKKLNFNTIIKIFGATKSEYVLHNPIFPKDLLVYETDTGGLKIGNGILSWNDLEYVNQHNLSDSQLGAIQAYNQPGNLLKLNDQGEIDVRFLPDELFQHIKYVADIESRDRIPEENRNCLVAVVSMGTTDAITATVTDIYNTASNDQDIIFIEFGEPIDETKDTVDSLDAYGVYAWEPTERVWLEIYKGDNLGVDYDKLFHLENDNLDIITDGANYVKMTIEERQRIQTSLFKIDTINISPLNIL